ncbi:S1C family serine protease [Persicirhabdus sediminis]|uniref:PDZ domain-containing protein n=1 Tax=Persicirhabdus sediminis TaxID=454144 RepID=A0A8J7MG42_9BACT|nr:PDZ domain-containing protein [Persicirhabdus sediminis]MBK1791179.1 PDZ domain-containing protein [Persicirhabdus sediminis]
MKIFSIITKSTLCSALTISMVASTLSLSAQSPEKSVIRINSTSQTYNNWQPWDKNAPSTTRALGAVLDGKQILTTAELAADAVNIELESIDGTRTVPAKVVAVDYQANLALLEAEGSEAESFTADLVPLQTNGPAKIGDQLEIWQVEDNGMPLITKGNVQSVDIVSSFAPGGYFLTYEAKASMQSASSSFSLPVVREGKLLGILTSYNSKDQIVDVIAPEIVKSFLEDAADGEYLGFPSLGIAANLTVDPSFRKWLKLPDDAGGLYISRILKGSAAENAGLQKNDVITAINGHQIGRRGYYQDDTYGQLYWSHLIRGSNKIGDTIKIDIMRDGKPMQVDAKLKMASERLIPRETFGEAPNYLVKGGFIFQELTQGYLSGFGKDWQNKAPIDLLDALDSPEDYEENRNRIVILSATIPTPATTGYESLRNLIVNKVNGVKIADLKSLAEAFQKPDSDGIHTIEFLGGRPETIYLDASYSDEVDAQLIQRGIPKLSRF